MDHAARGVALAHFRVLEVIGMLWLVLGVEVIERSEKLLEAVRRRQVLVEVAQVILPKLASGVSHRSEQFGNGYGAGLQALLCPGQAHLEQTSPETNLPRDEAGAPGRT